MSFATPADVLARRRHLTLNGDADGLADLFAPDAVIEFAFHGRRARPCAWRAGRRSASTRATHAGHLDTARELIDGGQWLVLTR